MCKNLKCVRCKTPFPVITETMTDGMSSSLSMGHIYSQYGSNRDGDVFKILQIDIEENQGNICDACIDVLEEVNYISLIHSTFG